MDYKIRVTTDANRPQVVDDLQIIFRIPWGHNKIINLHSTLAKG